VSILAALYVLLIPAPALLIPINALIHALSGVLVFKLGCSLLEGRPGKVTGIIASVIFVMLPSSLNWVAQVHKDGYVIFGYLIIIYSWVLLLNERYFNRAVLKFVLGITAGGIMIASCRPYVLQLLVVVSLLMCCASLVMSFFYRGVQGKRLMLTWIGIIPVVLLLVTAKSMQLPTVTVWGYGAGEITNDTEWVESEWLPDSVENIVRVATKVRASFLHATQDAGSNIDEVIPNSIKDVFLYLPRLTQVALFAPFPDFWFEKLSMTRLVGVLEMTVWYLIFPGVFLTFIYNRNSLLLLVVIFAISFMLIYAYAVPNLGTLHRMRYPFLSLLMLVGLSGWVRFIYLKNSIKS
jgi:hypothetical protein